MANRQTEEKITALNERLSRDDDLTGDSNFILNQKRYLESYAAQRGYANIIHYTDDWWSPCCVRTLVGSVEITCKPAFTPR